MASKSTASVSFFLFFALASACYTCSAGPPIPANSEAGTLNLAVCADLLNGLINVQLGVPPKEPCCSLLSGLADLDAAVLLCPVVKANVLGLNVDLTADLSLVLNCCGKTVPTGYTCI